MNPRSEPLLWLQLVALGAIPLELLLLLLVLAGADPGPLPALERLLLWGVGVLAPALVLWRRPADCCSLLLVQVPQAGRSALQQRLVELQDALPPRLLLVIGAALLLPLLWQIDTRAVIAAPLSPLSDANRLVSVVLAIPLLALLTWQWQQLGQSLWLLARPADMLAAPATVPLDAGQVQRQHPNDRLSLGLPLLLLAPLEPIPNPTTNPWTGREQHQETRPLSEGSATAGAPEQKLTPTNPTRPEPAESAARETVVTETAPNETLATEAMPLGEEQESQPRSEQKDDGSFPFEAVTVEPEQAPEDDQGGDLDQQVP
ncbi:MAG: low-complexity tail membrane protein [Cyanobacteriota bacterium]|nr:low-complexity tail membrane protein [Cyanobacteriota bacterium]